MDSLPLLIPEDLNSTRDYLQDVTLAVGAFARVFLPEQPRDWHYGLDVYMRGISTPPLQIAGDEKRVLIDLHANKVRLDDVAWPLEEYAGAEIYNNLKVWLESHNIKADLPDPELKRRGQFDPGQARHYLDALWWLDRQLKAVRAGLSQGVAQPVLLYPHHFDLSLVWFPWDDERQLSVGWSTGDERIAEPYIYLTAYPEPAGFTQLELPAGAFWQKAGFSGAILPYQILRSNPEPDKFLQSFTANVFTSGHNLFAK